jgi:hypothetical protein
MLGRTQKKNDRRPLQGGDLFPSIFTGYLPCVQIRIPTHRQIHRQECRRLGAEKRAADGHAAESGVG